MITTSVKREEPAKITELKLRIVQRVEYESESVRSIT